MYSFTKEGAQYSSVGFRISKNFSGYHAEECVYGDFGIEFLSWHDKNLKDLVKKVMREIRRNRKNYVKGKPVFIGRY